MRICREVKLLRLLSGSAGAWLRRLDALIRPDLTGYVPENLASLARTRARSAPPGLRMACMHGSPAARVPGLRARALTGLGAHGRARSCIANVEVRAHAPCLFLSPLCAAQTSSSSSPSCSQRGGTSRTSPSCLSCLRRTLTRCALLLRFCSSSHRHAVLLGFDSIQSLSGSVFQHAFPLLVRRSTWSCSMGPRLEPRGSHRTIGEAALLRVCN